MRRRISRHVGGWVVEALIDPTCLLVGINYSTRARWRRSLYVHVGPLILGAYEDR